MNLIYLISFFLLLFAAGFTLVGVIRMGEWWILGAPVMFLLMAGLRMYDLAQTIRPGPLYVEFNIPEFLILGLSLFAVLIVLITANMVVRDKISLFNMKSMAAMMNSIVETAVDGIISVDEEGIIRTFNQSAVRIFGYTADEVIGRNVSHLMPFPHSRDHDRYIRDYIHTGQAKVIGIGREVTGKKKDGTLVPLHLSLGEFFHHDRRYFAGIIRDLTRIKEAESDIHLLTQMIIRIQEEERSRISADIHDSLGQSLVALNYLVQNLLIQVEKDPILRKDCANIIEYSRKVINNAREISHTLSPIGLAKGGLISAVKELAESFRSGGKIELVLDIDDFEGFFPGNWEINLYRIIQESLTNAYKHASPTRVEITAQRSGDSLTVRIRDNGKGIKVRKSPGLKSSKGLGTFIMEERASMLGGVFGIRKPPQGGTEVVIEIQKTQETSQRGGRHDNRKRK